MTDADKFLDYVTQQARWAQSQLNYAAADLERHFDEVATHLKEWLPAEIALRPTPPPRRLPPPTTWQLVTGWVDKHRAVTAAMLAFAVTGSVGAVLFIQDRKHSKKRRARRSASGARTEVVVLAGPPSSPIMSALALDLERRGFVVYIVANTSDDETYIKSLSRADLLPLPLDLTDPFLAQEQLARFQNLISREHTAFDGADPHRMSFAGLVLVPDTASSLNGPVESISSEEWSDALNAKVLNTIATTQLFLPALKSHQSRILLLTPSVTPSLRLPDHGVESTVYGALSAYASTLTAELKDQGVTVSHFRLGNFDIPSITAKQRREGQQKTRLRATPLRSLHNSVFDALVARRPYKTWHVGRGSLAYDIIGSLAPPSMISWMMGLSGRRKEATVEETEEDVLQSSQGSLTWEKVEEADSS